MTDLAVGAIVRVRPLGLLGQITGIATRMKRHPYLVRVPGMEARLYAYDELERLPEGTVMTMPPFGVWGP
jgi:hypothetical protein